MSLRIDLVEGLRIAVKSLASHRLRTLLTVPFVEQWFVVEGFQLRRPACHEEVDNAFNLGRKMRPAQNAESIFDCRIARGRERIQQGTKRDSPEAEAKTVQELAAVQSVHRQRPCAEWCFHRFITNSS